MIFDANQQACPEHPDRASIDAGSGSEPWKGMYAGTHHFLPRRRQGRFERICMYCNQSEDQVRKAAQS